jgi:hypothetical protein
MIEANYEKDAVEACSDQLAQTEFWYHCLHYCEFAMEQALQDQKAWAALEEYEEGHWSCQQKECAWSAGSGSASGSGAGSCQWGQCEDCTTCKDTADANYFLVKNVQTCTGENCGVNTDLLMLEETSTYSAITTAMGSCMETAVTEAHTIACIEDSVKDTLESGGDTATDVDVYDYLYDSATNAVMHQMSECSTNAGNETAALKACLDVHAKESLRVSLGLGNASDVSGAMLLEYVTEAAKTTTSNSIDSCMAIAENADQRFACTSSGSLKASLAASLGKDPSKVTDATLQEFVAAAAQNKMTSVVQLCMADIAASASTEERATAATQCREETGCTALAKSLGKLPEEFSAVECKEYMDQAERKQVQDKMKACTGAIKAEDDQQAGRAACKENTARAALATMLGVSDAEEISDTDLQRYVREAAIKDNVPGALIACMDAIDADLSDEEKNTETQNCKVLAGNALAEGMGLLPEDVTAEDVAEAIQQAAMTSVKKAIKACTSLEAKWVAEGTAEVNMPLCKSQAMQTAAKASGRPEGSLSEMEFSQLIQNGALDNVLLGVEACVSTGTTCDFNVIFTDASGTSMDGKTTDQMAIASGNNGKQAAKKLIKVALQSCEEAGNGDLNTILECAKDMVEAPVMALDPNFKEKRNQVFQAVVRELSADRMLACMQDPSNTKEVCKAKALAAMNLYQEEATDKDYEDAMAILSTEKYTLTFGSGTGGVACTGPDCLNDASSEATAFGGTGNEKWVAVAFNALRAAANEWCNCEIAEASNCEDSAKDMYASSGGIPAQWVSTIRDQAKDLSDGYCEAGAMTEVTRRDSQDLVFEFPNVCGELDIAQVTTDITSSVIVVDAQFTVEQSAEPFTYDGNCLLSYIVSMPNGYDEAKATALGEININAVLTNGRRGTSSGETSSLQTTTECSDCSIPTPGPTPGPTEEPVLFTYELSTSPDVFGVRRNAALRQALIDAFASVAGVPSSAVTIASITASVSGGTEVSFAVSGTVASDLNEKMANGAFGNAFVAAALAAGYVVELPTVTIICPAGEQPHSTTYNCVATVTTTTSDTSESSSADFTQSTMAYVLYAACGVLFVAILVGLFIGYRKYNASKGRLKADYEDCGSSPRDQMLLASSPEASQPLPSMGVGIDADDINLEYEDNHTYAPA